MEQKTLENCDCEYCGASVNVDTNEFGELVCINCALEHHVSDTAASATPGYDPATATASLWVVLTGDYWPNGSDVQSRPMSIAEMRCFIKDCQQALISAIEMEERYAKDGE